MQRFLKKIKNSNGNALVENVIILPFLFIIIYSLILTAFIVHDKGTIEAAAKRGAIYASHCISDPNYAAIVAAAGNNRGSLDISSNVSEYSFTGIGSHIKAYRYILGDVGNIKAQVEEEVLSIIEATRIPWKQIDVEDITYSHKNKFYYQDVTVTVAVKYPLPALFKSFGLEDEYEYGVSAKMTVNDPDEFIRNADLAVDLIAEIDRKTGNHVSGIIKKFEELGTKIIDWFSL